MIDSTSTESLRPPRPRVWTAVVVPLISLCVFLATSGVMIAIAFFVVHGNIDPVMLTSPEGLESISASRIGLILLVITPQLALATPSICAAFLSPVAATKRLSIVRGHWPLWAWVAAAATTPVIGWMSSIVVGLLMDESEHLRMTTEMFRAHGESGFLIPLALLIGITPAICEELLFRGYLQTRLIGIFGPTIAIFVSSVFFALFHIDWMHALAVFPIGLFLGIVAWQSGSLLPAMLAHCYNNIVSVVAVVIGPENPDAPLSPTMLAFLAIVLLIGWLGVFWVGIAMWFFPVPDENSDRYEAEIPAADDPAIAL